MEIPFVDLHAQYLSLKDEFDSVIAEVINSTAFISGTHATEFENAFAKYLGIKHIIACANGTDALEILLQAMGISEGDEVIVPAISWISTSEAVTTVGGIPVFVDVDEYATLDSRLIENAITPNTKAIIPVHLYGQPANMPEIMKIAEKHDLLVLEDCAQAHGAKINGQMVGTFGHAASFSFYPGKNLGAYGDAGGMATNDDALAQVARMISNHGQKIKHEHLIEGRNSRMDGIQAAVLNVKLPHLDQWTEKRIANAEYYDSILNQEFVESPIRRKSIRHVYHLYVIQTLDREELQNHLNKAGISTGIHYPTPLPLLKCYSDMEWSEEDFPTACHLCKSTLSLPMYPELSKTQMDYIAKTIHSFFTD